MRRGEERRHGVKYTQKAHFFFFFLLPFLVRTKEGGLRTGFSDVVAYKYIKNILLGELALG